MDEIRIRGLEIFAHHGVFAFETEQGQNFVLNVTLYADLHPAGRTDDLTLSTHYGEVCHFLTDFLQKNTFQLIEAAAEQATRALLLAFPLVRSAELELCKPEAPIGLPFRNVSVCIRRGWKRVYLAYGSNLGDSAAHIRRGLEALGQLPTVRLLRQSSTLTTQPYGGVAQPCYLNGAVEAETLLTPEELLEALHSIEAAEGRNRAKEVRWGPRTLDLDILDYEGELRHTSVLTLPHPDMHNRTFVLQPLAELNPQWLHPLRHVTAAELLRHLTEEEA